MSFITNDCCVHRKCWGVWDGVAKTVTPNRPSFTSICLSPKPLQLHYTETLWRRGKDIVLRSQKCYRYQITSTDYNAHSNFARLKIFDISGINVFSVYFIGFQFRDILRDGPGSVVGIATGYRPDGPGIESRWGRDFPHLSRPALGLPSLLYNGYGSFPGVKSGRGVKLTLHLLLMPWSRKGRAILLPLWAVRPLQSLSVCTRVHLDILRGRPSFYSHMVWNAYRREQVSTQGAVNIMLRAVFYGGPVRDNRANTLNNSSIYSNNISSASPLVWLSESHHAYHGNNFYRVLFSLGDTRRWPKVLAYSSHSWQTRERERERTDQTVRRRPLTAEALVLPQVCPCEICGRQSGTRTGFSHSASVAHSQYHSTLAPYPRQSGEFNLIHCESSTIPNLQQAQVALHSSIFFKQISCTTCRQTSQKYGTCCFLKPVFQTSFHLINTRLRTMSQNSAVGTIIWSRAARPGVRIPAWPPHLSLLKNVHTGSGTKPAFYSMGTGAGSFLGGKPTTVGLTTRLHPAHGRPILLRRRATPVIVGWYVGHMWKIMWYT